MLKERIGDCQNNFLLCKIPFQLYCFVETSILTHFHLLWTFYPLVTSSGGENDQVFYTTCGWNYSCPCAVWTVVWFSLGMMLSFSHQSLLQLLVMMMQVVERVEEGVAGGAEEELYQWLSCAVKSDSETESLVLGCRASELTHAFYSAPSA